MIVAECPACGKRFKADERLAGRKSKCSKCGEIFVVELASSKTPAAAPVGSSASQNQEPQGSRGSALTVPPTVHRATLPAAVHRAIPVPQVVTARRRPETSDTGSVALDHEVAPSQVGIAAYPPPPRKRRVVLLAMVAALVVVGGAAAALVPRFLAARSAGPSSAQRQGGGISSPGDSAWTATPDASSQSITLPQNFRLSIPAQIPMRHDPNSMVMAPAPGSFLAITLLPDPHEPGGPSIEVWNLVKSHRDAQFRINQPLSGCALSPDGAYYAGLVINSQIDNARVEVWSAAKSARVLSVDTPSRLPGRIQSVLGFEQPDRVAVFGDRLTVWDLTGRTPVREIALPTSSDYARATASAHLKLVAVADSTSLALIDLSRGAILGTTQIPQAALAHPRQPLTLREMRFSPDGRELALLFENQQSTRRIAVYDVARGMLKSLQTTAEPPQDAPFFQWTPDSRGFLLASGALLDRSSGRQIGQVYTDRPDEGLGGVLGAILPGDRALALWNKYPKSLVLRSIPVHRDDPQWINVSVTSAAASRFEQLQCVSREFGNELSSQSLSQSGRLTDGSQFLVVDAQFIATLSAAAPPSVPLREDQFALLADGRPRLPIGTINADGFMTLERPAYDLHRGDAIPRRRAIVFGVRGDEKSLALQMGPSVTPLDMPPDSGVQPPPTLAGSQSQRLASKLFSAPDDASLVSVRIVDARVKPFELDPQGAGDAPLRITYSAPAPTNVLAVTFDLDVNLATNPARGNRSRIGLMMPDGVHLSPAITLPTLLPAALVAGEHYRQTCLFVIASSAAPLRLTFDGSPVATFTPQRN